MPASRDFRLYALLILASAARLLLQMAAMPPYAGLDEIYHAARFAFVLQEHRNPSTREPSIPPYLDASIDRRWDALPAFCVIGERWPQAVASSGGRIIRDRTLAAADLRPYGRSNYEAQQTSIAYSLIAPAARLLGQRTAVSELRVWRFASVLFALLTVIGTAVIAHRLMGPAGIAATAVMVSLPTWLTLTVRASNDAFACAIVTVAIAISTTAPRRWAAIAAEALAWGLAVNAKLYTWPLAAALPFFWRRDAAPRRRVLAVTIAGLGAAAITLLELSRRTGNPLGIVVFDRTDGPVTGSRVDFGELIRVSIASAAWTSGQHWDALRPLGIALIFGPIVLAMLIRPRRETIGPAMAVLLAFAAAQAWNVVSCVRAGAPIGGKEGWYWYVLLPVVLPALLAPAVTRFRALTWWMVAWDIVITEGALFHDYAGVTSPAHPSTFFRWGPWQWPFTAHLANIGVGPLVGALIALRIIHVIAVFALQSITRFDDRSHNLALSHP